MDNYIADLYERLAPHKSVFDLESPYNVSTNISKPKPVVASISNFITNGHSDKLPIDQAKVDKMKELFGAQII